MDSPALGSILLASTDPVRLRDFYTTAFGATAATTPDGSYDVLVFGDFYVVLDQRDDVGDTNPEPGRVILNIDVADARRVAAGLDEMGARWLAELEDRDGSLFGTIVDPDGNYVQILQPNEEHRAHRAKMLRG